MYEEYWGLAEPAFSLTPDPKYLYLSKRHQDCLTMLKYCVKANKGAAMVTGDIGCGKTTLSRKFLSELDETKYQVAMIVNPVLSPVQLLREIALQLDLEKPPKTRQNLVQIINEELLRLYQNGRHVVLIVDEAHLIRDRGTFEELRLLLNFQLNDKFLITLILFGQNELIPKIERIPALKQRLAVRSKLAPLDEYETEQLINYRLKQAWYMGEQSIFTPDAVGELHRYTNGYPRVICEVADNALLLGMAQEAKKIDGFLMKHVIFEFEGKDW